MNESDVYETVAVVAATIGVGHVVLSVTLPPYAIVGVPCAITSGAVALVWHDMAEQARHNERIVRQAQKQFWGNTRKLWGL